MKYLLLDRPTRDALRAGLERMPEELAARFAGLAAEERLEPGPGDTFSPVEHCWHLADLEKDGFGARLRRLLEEDEPFLPDFDGLAVAEAGRYRERTLEDGLAAFRAARAGNLELLAAVTGEQWSRAGEQEGVGRVAVCDLPVMMAEHDAGHRAEIDAWFRAASAR